MNLCGSLDSQTSLLSDLRTRVRDWLHILFYWAGRIQWRPGRHGSQESCGLQSADRSWLVLWWRQGSKSFLGKRRYFAHGENGHDRNKLLSNQPKFLWTRVYLKEDTHPVPTFSPGLQVEINNVISFDINATLQQTLKYTQRTHVVCFCPLVDIFKEPHKYVGKGK